MDFGCRPTLHILSADRLEQIVSEALQTIEEVGVLVENTDAVELLAGAGAAVSDDKTRVFIPPDLCKKCIETVPASFSIYDRGGAGIYGVGGDEVVFDPGSTALSVYDFSQKKIRKPTTKDVVEFVLLTEALPFYDYQSTCVVPADLPENLADRYRLFLALIYGKKPVVTGTFTADGFSTMRALLEAVRGGGGDLKAKPLAVFDCCPTAPLAWSDLTCDALLACARHGIPAQIISMPLTGATAPVTLAGALVQHTAESLSGVVIHQLANPGAPLVYGGAPASFEMRHATTLFGAVETMLIDVAYAQIGKHFGFPVHAYMGLSDAKLPDYQAGFESAAGIVMAALAGINVVSGPGMLNFVGTQSLEKLVLDNEICGMARRMLRGIEFRDESAGKEQIRSHSIDKLFLTSDHTRKHFRQEAFFPTDVIDRAPQSVWESAGSLGAPERAHARARQLLDRAEIHAPDKTVLKELAAIMLADARACGVDKLPDWAYALER